MEESVVPKSYAVGHFGSRIHLTGCLKFFLFRTAIFSCSNIFFFCINIHRKHKITKNMIPLDLVLFLASQYTRPIIVKNRKINNQHQIMLGLISCLKEHVFCLVPCNRLGANWQSFPLPEHGSQLGGKLFS